MKSLLPLAALMAIAVQGAQLPPSLRLYVFDCGRLDTIDTAPYRLRKEELKSVAMAAPCFLIAHPKGTLRWDTGPVADNSFKDGVGKIRYATALKTLTSQLASAGFAPADVTYLALSHYHWDHVGNSNLFATSTWLTPRSERDTMFQEPPSYRTEPQNYSALRNAKTVFIEISNYDVFGDGSAVIVAAPGHSPGHQVLFLKLPKTGPVVISGDLYHYPEERRRKLLPLNEFNVDQAEASRIRIEKFLKESRAQLWIQHDMLTFQKLKLAPAYSD